MKKRIMDMRKNARIIHVQIQDILVAVMRMIMYKLIISARSHILMVCATRVSRSVNVVVMDINFE
jgi:hypothetical protein